MKKYDVAIIGGGLSGLFIAYKLSKIGKKVIVIEGNKILGGMLRSLKIEDYFIEEFYHHIFPNNYRTIGLIEELGLKDKLKWNNAKTSFYFKKKFYNLTKPSDLLFFKPLSFREKVRLGLFLLNIKLIKFPGKFDSVSAEEFIVKRAGSQVYQKFFMPLLSAKYGKILDKISAAWIIERINMRNKRGYKGEVLGYLEGGFQKIIESLREKIVENNGKIITEKFVTKLVYKTNKALFLNVGNSKIYAESFVSTIPGPSLSRISNLPKDYKQKLNSLTNQGSICVLLGLRKQISDFYWTNLIEDKLPFRAIIEHTNFQPPSNYRSYIVYLASYPEISSKIWKFSDKEIFELYFKGLKELVPLTSQDVKWYRVIREKNAGLIYTRGIVDRILPIKTPVSNLFIAGMLNSYPDRNLEESIRLSTKLLDLIA